MKTPLTCARLFARGTIGSRQNRNINTASVLHQQAAVASYYEEDQLSLQKTARAIIDNDINPHVDEWEAAGQYPAKIVMKKLGDAGLLGVNKPVEYGGMGLDFKYSVALSEAMGYVKCGAIPMSVAVQTDMATPALAR